MSLFLEPSLRWHGNRGSCLLNNHWVGKSRLLDGHSVVLTFLPFIFAFEVDLAANSLLNKLIRQSLVESSHRVEVLQKDPSSPLYSVKTFEELRLWVFLALFVRENAGKHNLEKVNLLIVKPSELPFFLNHILRRIHITSSWNTAQRTLGYLNCLTKWAHCCRKQNLLLHL